MRLFGRRDHSSDESSSPAAESLNDARAALRGGDAQEALRLLAFGFGQDPGLRPLYETAREALRQLGAPEEVELFAAALRSFESPRPFYELGYHFVGAGNDRLAVPFLERAHSLAPQDVEIANELALALCGQFEPQRAAQVLGQVLEPLDSRPFWASFQWHWARLLSDQREGIAEWIDEARATLARLRMSEEQAYNTRYALDKLASALQRLESVGEPEMIVRDWHFVQYGAAVLDLMDERVAEGGLEVAGGRYVALWGQPESIRLVLEKLKEFLAATHHAPRVVVAHEDRDSQIIGMALSQVLGRPFETVSDHNVARPHALVVVGDSRAIEWDELATVAPGQVLFAFNQHWLEASPLTPDVCGLMSQSYAFPWQGGGMTIDPDSGDVSESKPDEREDGDIAAEIASAPFEPDPSWPEALEFYASRRTLLANARAGGPRVPFLTDSPVPGSYFC